MTIKLVCAVCAIMERGWKAKMPSINHTASRWSSGCMLLSQASIKGGSWPR